MNEFYIKVDSVDKVKDFVKVTNKIVPDMDLIVGRYIIDAKSIMQSGKYYVDAKSIMGIFSVDLTRKICLKIHSDNEKECTEIRKKLEKFIVE